MAKCPICNSRKGKRKCVAANSYVCSVCCGQSRNAEKCGACSYFKDDRLNRDYNKTPYIALQRMADNLALEGSANVIESALCQFDLDHHENVSDKQAARLLELLLDKYFFGDPTLNFESKLEEEGFELIDQAIKEDLGWLSNQEVSEFLGTIYRSIKRRDLTDRDYMEFIQRHVGVRMAKGLRAIPDFPVDES